MSFDYELKLIRKIQKINKEIDDLCYDRDNLIEELHEIQDMKGTESD